MRTGRGALIKIVLVVIPLMGAVAGHLADRHGDRAARVDDLHPAREPVGRVHGDRAHAVVAEVLLHLRDQLDGPIPDGGNRALIADCQEGRQAAREGLFGLWTLVASR